MRRLTSAKTGRHSQVAERRQVSGSARLRKLQKDQTAELASLVQERDEEIEKVRQG